MVTGTVRLFVIIRIDLSCAVARIMSVAQSGAVARGAVAEPYLLKGGGLSMCRLSCRECKRLLH